MGLAASVGKDNDELIDNLVSNDSLKTERIEKIMRLVDRGKFLPETERENAYKDSAWKSEMGDPGFFHMSAPCIYASVLENLDLDAGMSFLNVGSGTGYLSSMVGFIIGNKGISHGIELYQNVTEFANDHIAVIQQSREASAFDWCVPSYETGNAFQIETQMKYDRIYCGALVPDSHRSYFCSLLKINGVLILPYGHALQRIVRNSESEFLTRDISTVTFSHLIPVNSENPLTNRPIKLPLLEPHSLRSICRDAIRHCVRTKVQQTRKVEMRVTCTESKEEGQTRNERNGNGEELNLATHRVREAYNGRHFPHRRRLQTIHLFDDGDDEDREVPEDDQPNILNNLFHQHPMQRFFTLVARERLNRHHAARARLQAVLGADINEHRQIRGQIRLILGNHNLGQQQHQPMNEDVEYGFRFVSENNLNAGADQELPNVLNIRTEHDEYDGGDNEEDDNNSAEEGETNQLRNTGEHEEEDTETRANISSIEEDGTYSSSEASNEVEGFNPKIDRGGADHEHHLIGNLPSFSPTTDHGQHLAQQQSTSEATMIGHSIASNYNSLSEEKTENAARISVKRQRTITRSHSLDNAPQLKRNFPHHNLQFGDQPSTSKNFENTSDESEKHIGEDKSKINDDQVATECCGSASDDNDDGSSTLSFGQKNEKSPGLTVEQQAEYLREFHDEFTRLLDSLPLNVQMHRFLKHELN